MARDPDVTRADFETFHRANPHVLRELVALARELVQAGVKPGAASIWTLLYRRRYLTLLERAQGRTVVADDDPKNDWSPYYARVIDAACYDLRGWLKLGGMQTPYVPDLCALGLLPPPPPSLP
jgi:hypothetical protein